ncbi:50S ribosomal protein L15 [Nanobdella aerobiophila]|uniref:Large ribosomal subunit protein uL15 n=1 Tax=Nanobdella aerobiophila TaxID=2586965 RepID=A0A915WS21_9ARCH|nr:uL15 family ribosomal protein [Nanobdella aerobiophila]BBL45894.1 50S ribosomal protein L15 [Nanobdella aerobiophila]
MVVHRRKKYRKSLGSRYARRGNSDRNRGKGNKGGAGFSGWRFKKQKYIKIIKEFPEKLEDKKGFTNPRYNKQKTYINLRDINNYFDLLLEEGILKEENNVYILNLNELNIDKLLGTGKIDKKMTIIVKEASENAIEKVKNIGGEVIIQ